MLKKIVLFSLFIFSCQKKMDDSLFELLDNKSIGVIFSNDLTYNRKFNVYKYRNFYNGGGVAMGDINNDGLLDFYLTGNQKENKLYINKGDFLFEDITRKAGVYGSKPWSTGVTMVDINADGFLDIYVCNSGNLQGNNKQNELFINNGDLTFTEKAAEYNLADSGYSTHASFFDYDRDGDLDVYILNNSYQAIGSFDLRRNERPIRDSLGGDKLMENRDGKYYDISQEAGIYGSIIGFGLGVTVGDVNKDGWDDIYISNDFFERDYLYINRKNGTFQEQLTSYFSSISAASMGADMSDINNDGFNDIFVTEMLPIDYRRLKTVTTFEDWNKYIYNVQNDYYHQFTRNTLQFNNTNNTFSEVGRLLDLEASDWSWGALFFDMNNDGWKDIFIANGVYKDLTNQDYLQYISNETVMRSLITRDSVNYKKMIDIIPSQKVPNYAYKNNKGLSFEKYFRSGLIQNSFSNGAAYGDLDNDGDLDLVVNNVNMPVFVYRNNAMQKTQNHYIKLNLKGEASNTFAIGAKIEVKTKNETLYYEQQPTRGFQSSVDFRPNIGLPENVDKVNIKITWPLGKISFFENLKIDTAYTFLEKNAKKNDKKLILEAPKKNIFKKINFKIPYKHVENNFVDFHRDRLLYHMYSTQGPKMSYMPSINGRNSILFMGGSKANSSFFIENIETSDKLKVKKIFEDKKMGETMGSVFFDADNDGDLDLYITNGGVEFSNLSSDLYDFLYFNDGQGNYALSTQKLPVSNVPNSTSSVVAFDYDRDGDLDLLIGERIKPTNYGVPCSAFLLENNGKGIFTDITSKTAPELKDLGMITDLKVADLDNDGVKEIVIVGEFIGIEIFKKQENKYIRQKENALSKMKGWWNVLHLKDINGDGKIDICAGNHGLNSRFKASTKFPITLYLNDFDKNGFLDPIITFRRKDGKNYPYALRHNLIDQIKSLKKIFPDYESFKNASINEMFSKEKLDRSLLFQVTNLKTQVLINKGDLNFETFSLPPNVQFSPVYAITSGDYDRDGDIDILMGGNLYGVQPEMGRYDASYGIYLENDNNKNFIYYPKGSGFFIKGEIRDMITLKDKVIVARNKDSLVVFEY